MRGRIFLAFKAEPEPEYVFSFRERMDERFDKQRSVRDKRFAYIIKRTNITAAQAI